MGFETEQLVKLKEPKYALVIKAVLIIACVLAATTIPRTGSFGIIVLALFVVATVFVFEYYNAELEYSIVDDMLTVDRIMAKSMRRKCGVYTLSRATLVARADSNDALRINSSMNLKTTDYSAGASNHDSVVICAYNEHNELERIFIYPNEKILEAIKEVVDKNVYKVDL